eukprot:1160894-Pelagomonas_calceolata.AAC.18
MQHGGQSVRCSKKDRASHAAWRTEHDMQHEGQGVTSSWKARPWHGMKDRAWHADLQLITHRRHSPKTPHNFRCMTSSKSWTSTMGHQP